MSKSRIFEFHLPRVEHIFLLVDSAWVNLLFLLVDYHHIILKSLLTIKLIKFKYNLR